MLGLRTSDNGSNGPNRSQSSHLLRETVIRGTRIMARNILGMVAGGYLIDRILASYPDLRREDVIAALEYAAKVVDEDQVIAH
jgi:uncharacterized protein (DUF433 family)